MGQIEKVYQSRDIRNIRLIAGAVAVSLVGTAERIMGQIEKVNQPGDVRDVGRFLDRAIGVTPASDTANGLVIGYRAGFQNRILNNRLTVNYLF